MKRICEKAIANLDQVDIVGTVERYGEWLTLAQLILCKGIPEHFTFRHPAKCYRLPGAKTTEAAIPR